MRVIIYNINSLGGNYEYAKELFHAYQQNGQVSECILLMPENASMPQQKGVVKRLVPDVSPYKNGLFRKLYFIYRSIVNPFRLLGYLKEAPDSFVIFNDYDQLTAPLWAGSFIKLTKKHLFAVILHDPDRDGYMPTRSLSVYTMKQVMRIMRIGFYHAVLPDKPYYKNVKAVQIPHGIYRKQQPDQAFYKQLLLQKGSNALIGIIGNIRDDKNYLAIIDALPQLPGVSLLVAGNPANSSISTEGYKQRIEALKLNDRVIWVQKFLSDTELNAAILACDAIVLYYKESFLSQSGILNNIAPYKKKILVSETQSALTNTVKAYRLGAVVPLNNQPALTQALQRLLQTKEDAFDSYWDQYIADNSWEKNVDIAINSAQQEH